MKKIKTYQKVHAEQQARSFDIKRMEVIFEKAKGQADEPHRHDYFTLVIVKNAKGKHIIDFNEFELGADQVYFVSPGQVHQIVEAEQSFGYAITFTRQFMMENGIDITFIEDLFLFNDFGYAPPLKIDQEGLATLSYFSEQMLDLIDVDQKYKYQAIGAWLKLLLILCHSFCALGRETNTQKAQASVTILKNFKNLLEKKYQDWHKVHQYAGALNVSADYLNASVKALTGKSVKEHIQSRITVAAKRLLRFSDLSTKEIAYELGFSEPANFSQFFKKCTGLAPSKFRT